MFGREEIDNISVRVAADASMERAMVDIERVLRRQHKLAPGAANDFSIVDRREFLDTQQEAQQTFTMLLASIAGVSLIVGGIGIMNIMLVSVTERTREIGIRMALGATRFSIMLQFLVESVTLCLLGGALGILLGTVAARTLSRFAGWEVFVSPESVGLAVGLQHRRRPVLRHHARAPRRTSRPDRSAALRVARDRSCPAAVCSSCSQPSWHSRARVACCTCNATSRRHLASTTSRRPAAATPFDSFERTPVELAAPFDETRSHEIMRAQVPLERP